MKTAIDNKSLLLVKTPQTPLTNPLKINETDTKSIRVLHNFHENIHRTLNLHIQIESKYQREGIPVGKQNL